jgi:uncharacterized LabA/DUF88 family protein
MITERVAIFIDGSNLYYKLRACEPTLGYLNFNYADFCGHLSAERVVVVKNYYIGAVRAKQTPKQNTRDEKLQKEQTILFGILESKRQAFTVRRGYLMKIGNSFHEKGVDVALAVDIVSGAYEDLYDTAIVVSSDTDLLPAIFAARSRGKRVEYVAFEERQSIGLTRNVDAVQLITRQQVTTFKQS